MNDKIEYYLDAKEILNEPTTSRAQREFKQQIEKDITETRIYQLERDPIPGNYDFEHLAKIHEKIFEHIYDWAGEVRLDDISKRAIAPDGNYEIGHFLYKDQIFDEFDKFTKSIQEQDYLKNLDKETFVKAYSKLYAQINEIHPFEEGNGRATKLMMNQLAMDAGYKMDLTTVSVADWNYACKRSLTDQEIYIDSGADTERMPKDMTYLEDVMNKVITPFELDYRNEAKNEINKDNEPPIELPTPGF
ncbi:Fic family protein [Acinetobacter sp. YH01009]|uniref:Fic/DOC family protein n=1 Tax=Acinetobacter TaxID=469 RepID=UPI0015D398B9|nr:Fic family protein [Acinetobacter sp. YH01009]